jgi:hypothetical protein
LWGATERHSVAGRALWVGCINPTTGATKMYRASLHAQSLGVEAEFELRPVFHMPVA